MSQEISEFSQVLFRLQELGIKNQFQLSQILNISPGGVSDAKKRGKFPKGWAFKLSAFYGKSVDWIFGKQEASSVQIELSLIKGLMMDIVELKVQINYLEGTVSSLRKEIDMDRLASAKKKQQDYPVQPKETTKKKPIRQVA